MAFRSEDIEFESPFSFGGKRFTSVNKQLMLNVNSYFEAEKKKGSPAYLQQPLKRTAVALNVGMRTLNKVRKEYKDEGKIESPLKRFKLDWRSVLNIDDFDTQAIRRTVYEFYSRKELPTLDKLLVAVSDKGIFEGGRTSLWKLLKEMGFGYKKRDGKRAIYEQSSVIETRQQYLRQIRKFRREGLPIVYLDETWLNAHHSVKVCT